MGFKSFNLWIRDVLCTQQLRVLDAKHMSNHDLWRHFEKLRDFMRCGLLARASLQLGGIRRSRGSAGVTRRRLQITVRRISCVITGAMPDGHVFP